jgi:hypothetical protein
MCVLGELTLVYDGCQYSGGRPTDYIGTRASSNYQRVPKNMKCLTLVWPPGFVT